MLIYRPFGLKMGKNTGFTMKNKNLKTKAVAKKPKG
jgi:hypothetical protein